MACNSGVVYFIPVPFVHLHSISILRILLELLCRTRTPRRIVQLETFFSCKHRRCEREERIGDY